MNWNPRKFQTRRWHETNWRSKNRLAFLLWVTHSILTQSLFGQSFQPLDELRINQITVNEGLTNNKINDITQDKNGYIWFGSDEGLNRYDGYEIINFQHNHLDSASISSNIVFTLFTDSRDMIWVGLRYGLDIYDARTNHFVHLNYKGRSLNNIRDFFEDSDGRVWVCAEEGLFYKNPGENNLRDFTETYYRLSKKPIHSFYIDSKGNKWIGSTDNGLYLIDSNQRLKHFKDTKGYRIENILEHEEKIWVCTFNHGLLIHNLSDSTSRWDFLNDHDPVSHRIRDIKKDKNGNLWFGSRNGLYMKPPGQDAYLLKGHKNMKYAKLAHNSVFSIFIDEFDIIWLGTYAGGIHYADLNQKRFRSLTLGNSPGKNVNDNVIFSIHQGSNDDIWFGTESGGVNHFDGSTKEFSYFLNNRLKNGIQGANIHALTEDNEQKLWIGTYDVGLIHLDPRTKTIKTYFKGDGICDLNSNHVYSVHFDSHNVLWAGTDEGLCRMEDECFECFEQGLLSKNGQTITRIYEDSKNRIWVGTIESGVFLYEKGEIRHILPDLISRGISTIYEDSEENLWFGGHENGLILYLEDTIHRYTLVDGIPNNTVFGILEDDHKNLWLSTSDGLLRFANGAARPIVEEPRFRIFDISNGIPSNQFNPGSACKMSNGDLYFGTIGGVTYFDPDEIEDNLIEPKVIITQLSVSNILVKPNRAVNGRVILTKDISETESITLKYDDDYLTLEFASIHYSNPAQHQYEYMLQNYDEEWIKAGSNKRYVTYTNLPGGTYTFRIRGTNYDGIWSSTDKELEIIVQPPWYQLSWVKALFALGVVILIIGIVRVRINFLLKQKKLLKNLVENRTLQIRHQNDRIEKQNAELTDTIKQLKSTQLKLIEAEKMSSLGQLTAGIAHEINNPANFILGGAECLENKLKESRLHGGQIGEVIGRIKKLLSKNSKIEEDEILKIFDQYSSEFQNGKNHEDEINKLIRTIKIGAERTVNIVKGLRAYSRIEEKDYSSNDLHENIDDTLLLLNHKINDGIEVMKKYGDLPKVYCNPGRINQVFMNLLANAIFSVGHKGVITIETKTVDENKVLISVADTGPGIDEQNIRRIYDPFFTTKRIGEGTGLGLSISKGIVEEHDGQIYFKSKKSVGTTFFVELPIYTEFSEKEQEKELVKNS